MPILGNGLKDKLVGFALKLGIFGLVPALAIQTTAAFSIYLAYGIVFVPCAIAFVFLWPHIAILLSSVIDLFAGALWYNLGVLPRWALWLTDGILAAMGLTVLVSFSHYRKFPRAFRIPTLLLFSSFVCSAILNKVPFLVLTSGARQYFRYIVIYFVATMLPALGQWRLKLLRAFFFLVFLQLPLAVISFVQGARADYVSGGLAASGGTSILPIICSSAACVFVGDYLCTGRFWHLAKCIGMMALPAISEIKYGMVVFPVSLLSTVWFSSAKVGRRALVSIVILAATVVGAFAYVIIYPDIAETVSSVSSIIAYNLEEYTAALPGGVYLGRLARVQVVARYLWANKVKVAFGIGPGEAGVSLIPGASGRFGNTVLAAAANTHITRSILELGLVGLIGAIWILVEFVIRAARLARQQTVDPSEQAIRFGLVGVGVSLLVGMPYTELLFYQSSISLMFWLAAAYIASVPMREPTA